MAQILQPNDVIQLRCWSKVNNQTAVNTFHYRVLSVTTGLPTDQEFLNLWCTSNVALYKAILCSKATYEGSTAQIISAPLGLLRLNQVGTGVGTGGAELMPTQTCGLTQWGTNFGGRRYRGRTYWPFPFEEGNGSTGFPNAGYLIGLDAFTAPFVTTTTWGMSSGSAIIIPVIRHITKPPVSPITPTQITSKHDSPQWATQRKRGAFGRPNVSPF